LTVPFLVGIRLPLIRITFNPIITDGGVRRASECVCECMGVCVYLRVSARVVVYVAPTRRCQWYRPYRSYANFPLGIEVIKSREHASVYTAQHSSPRPHLHRAHVRTSSRSHAGVSARLKTQSRRGVSSFSYSTVHSTCRVYLGKYLNGPHHSSLTKEIRSQGRGFKTPACKGTTPATPFHQ
jgi:hypothetical protein